jgi:hypothetical protein
MNGKTHRAGIYYNKSNGKEIKRLILINRLLIHYGN